MKRRSAHSGRRRKAINSQRSREVGPKKSDRARHALGVAMRPAKSTNSRPVPADQEPVVQFAHSLWTVRPWPIFVCVAYLTWRNGQTTERFRQ
jgi:hypothetical protein